MRAVVLALTLSSSGVLLPIAINVGTGGTAPPFLAPYVDWVWPLIIVLWAVFVATGLAEIRARQRNPVIAARSGDTPRNRAIVLTEVNRYLRQRVDGSLAARTRVALALDQRPELVGRPFDIVVRRTDGEHRLPDDAPIGTVFDELELSMLILGAPGAGKTTLLLELARTLADQAHTQDNEPMPVLVNLSSWTASLAPGPNDHARDSPLLAGFVRWLLEQIDNRYGLHPLAGRRWLVEGKFILLLDGLDEIDPSHRDKLTGVLDELRMSYRIAGLAVTCRTHDYTNLKRPLLIQGAVDIKPLSRQQVLDYFAAVGPELDGARAAIEQDDELWDLVTSPLMLNVLLLAYQDVTPEAVADLSDVRRELFDTFLVEVLARRRKTSRQYDALTAVRALRTLAIRTRSRRGAQSVVPRWPSPDGREADRDVVYLLHTICLPALLAGVAAGSTLVAVAQYGVLAGLTTAVCALLLAYRWKPSGSALWQSRHKRRQLAVAATSFVIGTALTGVLLIAATGLTGDLTFVSGVVTGLLLAWAVRSLSFMPNYWQLVSHSSARWRIGPGLLAGSAVGIGLALLLGADHTAAGLAFLPGVAAGMVAVGALPRMFQDAGPLYRVLLDTMLCWSGELPWRRRAFLMYAADRFVLARTAPGEYSFIHLLVRDHLAESEPDELAAKVERRTASRRPGRTGS
ncbi:NACHT domain-containing protein [Kribbella antibiotica]|uniref:NACHT domain-containing protein n=1 Tax=Kribbella antibiotica TaxID=190195 RepID=A0A4R4YW41_9ACTN|nr:NACHT domain-containing protein [Kribbella antibiotica]